MGHIALSPLEGEKIQFSTESVNHLCLNPLVMASSLLSMLWILVDFLILHASRMYFYHI